MSTFQAASSKQHFPSLEEKILAFWKEYQIFEKTLERTERPVFNFYEGPPTANGRPGVHHVLARAFKDVIPRYKTMQGYIVPRKAGWDCHGLPVEVEVEKQLGLRGKKQIEEYGLEAFNKKCKESTFRYIQDWNKLTERIGFWLDTKNPYQTLDASYIESCWYLLYQIWEKGLLGQNYKIVKHCPRCETSLAEAEASQGMKETQDPAIFVLFPVLHGVSWSGSIFDAKALLPASKENPISLLIWTTTPWTLPANAAVAVQASGTYVLCDIPSPSNPSAYERVILHKNRLSPVLGENIKVLGEIEGKNLISLVYYPPFPKENEQNNPVVTHEIVTSEDGTGIVHIAPAYGDLDVGKMYHLPFLFPVGLDGVMTYPNFCEGKFFKEADPLLIKDLKTRGLLLAQDRIKHNYPFCWRCDTPLMYYAKNSWYILTSQKKEELLVANQKIQWFPEHIQEGRFGDWLRNNVDWAISRERYFGTPIPVWQCGELSCNHFFWIKSIEELNNLAGRDLQKDPDFDLHRPYIDKITFPCKKPNCKGTMKRIKEVLDCWFDSGAMPYAQHHYPFENKEALKTNFPADFICEGVDQTRGWFYTLLAISVLVDETPAYKNCIALGHILDEQGRKMSKRLQNIIDPWLILDEEGADALRYCLYSASAPGQPRRFSKNIVRDGIRQFILPLWNCYGFFTTYAEIEYDRLGKEQIPWKERPIIDQWALGKLHRLIHEMTLSMESYDIHGAIRKACTFVEDLSTWYVRRNRDRFWSSLDGTSIGDPIEINKRAAYQTLYESLTTLSQLIAPFLPFIAEELWQKLIRPVKSQAALSVHLSSWPKADPSILEETSSLLYQMEHVLTLISLGRAARVENNLKIRQPLSLVKIQLPKGLEQSHILSFEREIKEELNVEEISFASAKEALVTYQLRPNLPVLGKKYGASLKKIQEALSKASIEQIQAWSHQVLQEESIELILSNEKILLDPKELLLSATPMPGYAAKSQEGYVVAIHTTLTDALRKKGIARELIRSIGELRKKENCKVTETVTILYELVGEKFLIETLQEQKNFIEKETFTRIETSTLNIDDTFEKIEFEQGIIYLRLVKNLNFKKKD